MDIDEQIASLEEAIATGASKVLFQSGGTRREMVGVSDWAPFLSRRKPSPRCASLGTSNTAPEVYVAAEGSPSWTAARQPLSLHRVPRFDAISITCSTGPVSSAA